MKRIRLLMGVACAVVLLFASSVCAYAMNFEAEEAYESIFVVYSGDYIGSGFAVGENTVVTNAHVIGNADDIVLYSYQGDTFRASIYLMDNSLDIAILSVDQASFVPLKIGNSDDLKTGEDIYAIGAPKSMGYTLTKGVISNKSRVLYGKSYIQIDAAINSGNSGGPLLNNNGEVIGVNSMKMSDAEGIGLAIPISAVVSFIENSGIVVGDNQIVDGTIPYIENSPASNSDSNRTEAHGSVHFEKKTDYTVIILCILLCLSVLMNIILLVQWMYRKNENIEYVPDASERTDFEIDILE